MKKAILIIILFFYFLKVSGEAGKHKMVHLISPETTGIKGNTFILEYQVFESHDKSTTETDTVRHPGDYIYFSAEGKAYMNYKGKPDSIDYFFPDRKSVSFGDTPFKIIILDNGFFKLYQDETEANGDYNKVTYLLKKK
ncbi:hypothetical protein F0919_17435 [Taibaiella lutea]|uniref:Lipocalin-like domain-containing protein n=1 Tax=Taibaiella lutea TaxID=2608001 RepID=A0A5M6CGK7_9BACT|nr:hypothetical protein [Taibaiella lutea]KAA5532565.1 hypothetical protein F0919_17435 [Taibaiella lutea]